MKDWEMPHPSPEEIAFGKKGYEVAPFRDSKWWAEKLLNPKDIKGESVEEQIDYARTFFELWQISDPRIKAMTIVGSTLKGYSDSAAESDIDLWVVAESDEEDEDKIPMQTVIVEELAEVRAAFESAKMKLGNRVYDIHLAHTIDGNKIERNIDERELKGEENFSTFLDGLVYPGIGHIEKYRDKVREKLNTMSPERREIWIMNIIKDIISFQSNPKIFKREMVKPEDREEFVKLRAILIEERVRSIFG